MNAVVLPKPAGAEMRVSLRFSPAFNRSIRRGRETSLVLPAPSAVEGSPVEGTCPELAEGSGRTGGT